MGVLQIAGLFQNAYASQQRAAKIAIATTIGAKRLAQVQDAASRLTDFTDWSSIDGTQNDSEFPDFIVSTSSQPSTLYSPCSVKELLYPAAERRVVNRSLRQVEILVRWDPSKPREKVRFVGFVGVAPPPPAHPEFDLYKVDLQVQPPSGPTAAPVTLSIYGIDNQPTAKRIPDLFYNWSVSPGSGNAVSKPTRDGTGVNITNNIDPITGLPLPTYGTVNLSAQARYMGIEKSLSTQVELGP